MKISSKTKVCGLPRRLFLDTKNMMPDECDKYDNLKPDDVIITEFHKEFVVTEVKTNELKEGVYAQESSIDECELKAYVTIDFCFRNCPFKEKCMFKNQLYFKQI